MMTFIYDSKWNKKNCHLKLLELEGEMPENLKLAVLLIS